MKRRSRSKTSCLPRPRRGNCPRTRASWHSRQPRSPRRSSSLDGPPIPASPAARRTCPSRSISIRCGSHRGGVHPRRAAELHSLPDRLQGGAAAFAGRQIILRSVAQRRTRARPRKRPGAHRLLAIRPRTYHHRIISLLSDGASAMFDEVTFTRSQISSATTSSMLYR